MKYNSYHIVAFICLVVFSSCASSKTAWLYTSFNEPAKDGLKLMYSDDAKHWNYFNHIFLQAQVGKEKIMRDPSMIRDKHGVYHLVWTTEWKGGNGFGYANSKDLLHWSKEQYITVMQDESSVVNVWAPELFYDQAADDYIIIWASTIPYRFDKGLEDEDNNHRLYFAKTKDFKNFSKAQLFFDPGYSVIDGVLLKRAANDYVFVFKDNTRPQRNIKVAFGSTPLGPFANATLALTPSFTEGPAIAHVKNEWLIYFDAYKNKDFEAIKTKDFKSFEDATKEITIPPGHKHGTIVQVTKKEIKRLQRALD